jgi:hypothetical protein
MATEPQFATVPRSPHIKLVNADGTTPQTLFIMGANGGVVRAIYAISNDTTARWITLIKTDGTIDLDWMTLKFNAASANYPLQYVNFMDPTKRTHLDPYEIDMHLAAGHGFKVRMETPISATSVVGVFAHYGEF